jgi:hypothetical protein
VTAAAPDGVVYVMAAGRQAADRCPNRRSSRRFADIKGRKAGLVQDMLLAESAHGRAGIASRYRTRLGADISCASRSSLVASGHPDRRPIPFNAKVAGARAAGVWQNSRVPLYIRATNTVSM